MGQGWSNTGAATAAAAEGPTAGAVPEVMAKRKKRSKNRKQKVADAKENGIVEQEAASVTAPVGGAEVNGKVELESPAAAAVPGTAKHKKMKKRKREQEVVNAKLNGTVQQEAASAASPVLAFKEMPKTKKKKEVKAKERAMTGQEAAATAVSALVVTPKCEGKAKEREIVEEGTTTSSVPVPAPEGTTKSKRNKLKKRMLEQQEPAQALSGPAVVDKIATSKSVACADVCMDPGNTEDPNCSKAKDANNNNEKTKEREMVEQGTTTSGVSAPEGATKKKRKKLKKKMQEQQEPAHALSGLVKLGNGGTIAEGASGDANISNLTNAEDPNCSKAKDSNDNDKEKAKEREVVEQGTTTSAVSVTEGTPEFKEEKEETGVTEQEATTSTLSAPKATMKCKRKNLMKKKQEQQEPAHALSGLPVLDKIAPSNSVTDATKGEGASSGDAHVSMDPINVEDPNCSKAKDTTTAAANNNKVKTKGREIVEHGTTAFAVSEGTAKCKEKKLKKKMQKQPEPTQPLSVVDKITVGNPVTGVTNREGVSGDADVSMDPVIVEDPNCSKVNDANDIDKENPKERDMVEQGTSAVSDLLHFYYHAEQEVTTGTVSAPEGATKHKRKKLKKNIQEEQKPAQVLSSLVAVDKIAASNPVTGGTNGDGASGDADVSMDPIIAEDPNGSKSKDVNDIDKENPKEMDMEEQGASAISAKEGTPKCNNRKENDGRIAEQEVTTGTVSAPEGTTKRKRKKLKKNIQEEQEPAQVLSGLVVVNKVVASKPVTGGTNGEGPSGDADVSMDPVIAEVPNCSKAKDANDIDKENPKERDMVVASAVSAMEGTPKCNNKKEKERGIAEQEVTTGTVSAPEGTTKRKRKKLKKNIQEEQEPAQVLSGLVAVDKIVASKPVTGGTNGEGPSGDADVSMDPINVEDPNSSKAKDANDKDKAKGREMVEHGTTTSAVSGRVAKDCLDSSMDHDLSSTCASCLVQAPKEKVRNIYSPRGSLIRFQRKKLLILDLNGLLADINMDNQNAHMAHAKVKGKLVFRRPYYEDFLRFCFQNFELGIWSSRKMENVYSVVDILMRDLKQHLLFCWDMSKCTFTGHKVIGDKHKPLVLKELKKLWNKEDPYLPWEQGEFSPSNTLLVDDSPYKALCNPPHTAIFPQPYSYVNEKDDFSLGPGGDLRVYLERLAAADDVQVFVRDNPFGQPSITESDPKWNFYSKIVNKVERGFSLKWKC